MSVAATEDSLSLSCPGNELSGYFHEVPLGQITLAYSLVVVI
jgi:hypothetical protein